MDLTFSETFGATTFILGVGAFIFLSVGAFVGYAAAQRPLKARALPWWLFGVIGLWFGVGIAASTGNIISEQTVIFFALPPILLGFLLSFYPPLKALIKEIPTHWLIGLQAYRAAGGVFLFPYWTAGILTTGFAMNAGIGDILTGIFAIPVAILVLRRGINARWAFLAWTAFGILDLIVAFGSAAYFGFAVEGVQPLFPITIIPLFFGPPFGILIHLITVRNFNMRHAAQEGQAPAAVL
ncbi:MAG: hypothetical protein AAF633_10550 [Chloroflexota bacterium]